MPFHVPVVTVPTVVKAVEPAHVDMAAEISLRTIVLIEGTPSAALGAARNVFPVCDANVAVSVPLVVTGLFVTVKMAGRDSPTLVTVPLATPALYCTSNAE